jgi:hypothetical protein
VSTGLLGKKKFFSGENKNFSGENGFLGKKNPRTK